MMKRIGLVLIGCLLASGAMAAEGTKGFQLSLTPDIAIQSRTTHIKGLSLGIWNENPQTGLALGFVNGATGDSKGVLFAPIANYAENYTGVQLALVNYNKGDFSGLQSGTFNYAGKLNGLQLGLVNYAGDGGSGVQIGMVNVISANEKWFGNFPQELAPFMVIVNWRM